MRIASVTLCVLALGLHAFAEEKPNQLLTSLGSTTISGYVDTSAHWEAADQTLLPSDYRSFPAVYITCRRVFREGEIDRYGEARFLKFTVHRIGGLKTNTAVYLTFEGSDAPVQTAVHFSSGESRAEALWQVADNQQRDAPRTFTARISLDPVRQQMPGAQYRLRRGLPAHAIVTVKDP